MAKSKYPLVELGPLPVAMINRTLGTELEPGKAILTSGAHQHIAERRGEDYALVMRHLQTVISDPLYIGQSPHHPEAFELVRRVVAQDESRIILAAVALTRNDFGNYSVHSAYPLTEEKVTKRIHSGHLCFPKK